MLVLERAPRGDLFHLHRSLPNCRMTEEQLRVLVLAPLLKALVYLHGRGVCHRDIKVRHSERGLQLKEINRNRGIRPWRVVVWLERMYGHGAPPFHATCVV